MPHTLTVELSEAAFRGLQHRAQATNATPTALAASALEQEFGPTTGRAGESVLLTDAERQAARLRFESHFGEVDLGLLGNADNDTIDADLAREYGDSHEGP